MQVDLTGQVALVADADDIVGCTMRKGCGKTAQTHARCPGLHTISHVCRAELHINLEDRVKVDLTGQTALVTGAGELVNAVTDRILQCGAVVHRSGSIENLDMLIYGGASNTAAETIREATRRMTGQGRVVVLASAEGLLPVRGDAEHAAAQAGLLTLTRALSLDLASRGVRVNAVASLIDRPGVAARAVSHTPVGRVARPEEVVNAVLFLLARAASYVTGHVLTVDGGWTAGFARDF